MSREQESATTTGISEEARELMQRFGEKRQALRGDMVQVLPLPEIMLRTGEEARARRALCEYIASLEADRARMDYAAKHFTGVNFAYGAPGEERVIAAIEFARETRFTNDLREVIDSEIARRRDAR